MPQSALRYPDVPLPSYADPSINAEINPQTVAEGTLQKEALEFFLAVVEMCGMEQLPYAFYNLSLRCDQHRFSSAGAKKATLLYTTLALALIEDIGPIEPYLMSGEVRTSELGRLILRYGHGCQIDGLKILRNKGRLSINNICSIYSIRPYFLANMAVCKDDVEAYRSIEAEHPTILDQARCRVLYKPGTQIRNHLQEAKGVISDIEFKARFARYLTALDVREREYLIDSDRNYQILIGCEPILTRYEPLDHQLRSIYGYHAHLNRAQDELLLGFGTFSRHCVSPTAEQMMLIEQTWLDFETAGISQADILVRGVMSHKDLNDTYSTMSQDEKARWLPGYVVEQAAEAGSKMTPALHHLNLLINRMPRQLLEAACSQPKHWEALYRATADRAYLPRLKDRMDRVLREDLGL